MKAMTYPDMEQLLEQGCDQCKERGDPHIHEELYIHSKCHTDSPTWARYVGGGRLEIECAECHELIVAIKVAPK
jgi:hypothetical protein